jgi:hypothetical protein
MLIPEAARANSVLNMLQVNAAFGALNSANESGDDHVEAQDRLAHARCAIFRG